MSKGIYIYILKKVEATMGDEKSNSKESESERVFAVEYGICGLFGVAVGTLLLLLAVGWLECCKERRERRE